jgi:hypothetical protein
MVRSFRGRSILSQSTGYVRASNALAEGHIIQVSTFVHRMVEDFDDWRRSLDLSDLRGSASSTANHFPVRVFDFSELCTVFPEVFFSSRVEIFCGLYLYYGIRLGIFNFDFSHQGFSVDPDPYCDHEVRAIFSLIGTQTASLH